MRSVLLVLALLSIPSLAHAGVTAGNPDERPSLLLRFGYGSGHTEYFQAGSSRQGQSLGDVHYSSQQYTGLITVPATRDASFLVGFSFFDRNEPNTLSVGQLYDTETFQEVSAALRFYLP